MEFVTGGEKKGNTSRNVSRKGPSKTMETGRSVRGKDSSKFEGRSKTEEDKMKTCPRFNGGLI